MSETSKSILKNVDGNILPQYYNSTIDNYEVVKGESGAIKIGIEDGSNKTLGSTNDAAVIDPSFSATEVALLKGLLTQLQGSGTGAMPVKLTGSKLEEQLTQADAVDNILTFTTNISAIEIFHQEVTWQEFVVNGLTITVPTGGYRTSIGGTPSTDVTIPAGISCIVGRLT